MPRSLPAFFLTIFASFGSIVLLATSRGLTPPFLFRIVDGPPGGDITPARALDGDVASEGSRATACGVFGAAETVVD